MTKPLGHGLVNFVLGTAEPHVVRVHMDDMLPTRADKSQSPLDITERLSDLIRDRLGELPFIVPTALTCGLNPVADLDRLRKWNSLRLRSP